MWLLAACSSSAGPPVDAGPGVPIDGSATPPPSSDPGAPGADPLTTTPITDPASSTSPPSRVVVTARLDVPEQQLGFAGTQGLTGGLGHPVVEITTSADSGPGSYRDALSGGQRVVRLSPTLDGETIHLLSPVEVTGNDITLDGNGVDVTVSGHATRFSGTNIVVAGMTYRFNDDLDEDDAVTFREATTTQVAGLFGNRFETASDGLVDVIWNQGNDVYVTMCGNVFAHHDKAVLIDSGDEDREGGRYFVTMCLNSWSDVYQRAPLSRRADVHQFNSIFEQYGDPDGNGGGSKAGGDGDGASRHLLENNIAVPRLVGDSTFDGRVVATARSEWAGPQLDNDSSVRIEGSLLATAGDVTATETPADPDSVPGPPYEYRLVDATPRLAEILRATAGTCEPVESERVSPCAPLVLLAADARLTVVVEGDIDDVESVEFVTGTTRVEASADDDDPTRWSVPVSELGEGPMSVYAEVTTTEGTATASDVAIVALTTAT